MINLKLNKSKTYLTYFFDKYIPITHVDNLVNTYLGYEGDYFYWCMLYKFSAKPTFTKYEQFLMSHDLFVDYTNHDDDYCLYRFNIPSELDDVIIKFLDGKFSELPDKTNHIIYLMKTFHLKYKDDPIRVLNKCVSLKLELETKLDVDIPFNNELSSIPDIDSENYTRITYDNR